MDSKCYEILCETHLWPYITKGFEHIWNMNHEKKEGNYPWRSFVLNLHQAIDAHG